MAIGTRRCPDQALHARQVGRDGMLDQVLDRREAGVAGDEDEIVAGFLLEHEIAEGAEQADQIIGLDSSFC